MYVHHGLGPERCVARLALLIQALVLIPLIPLLLGVRMYQGNTSNDAFILWFVRFESKHFAKMERNTGKVFEK